MVKERIIHGPKPLIPISTESVGVQFYNHLKRYPDDIALNDPIRKLILTNKEVLQNSSMLAIKLQKLNLKENDTIGICVGNELEVLYIILASLYLGVTVANLNPHYTLYEATKCVEISKPRIIFCSSVSLKIMNKVKEVEKIVVVNTKTTELGCESFESFISGVKEFELETFQPIPVDVNENVAFIMYSSGTTGFPKGVCITHKNVNTHISYSRDPRYKARYYGKTVVIFLPLFHAVGLYTLLLNLINRIEIVLLKSFDPKLYLQILQDKKVEVIIITPTIAAFLAKNPLVKNYKLSIKTIVCGSSCLSAEVDQKLNERIKLKHFWQGYGMTELTFGTTSPTIDENKFGSCGQLLPHMSSKVIDPNTGKTLDFLEIGELCFKGPLVMKGYKNNIAATKEMIDENGWLHSGDAGYYDKNGFLFIVDRYKELIKYKEFQVSPAELENILISHSKILEAAVVGVPNKDVGELPFAFVVKNPKESLTEREVQEFVADKVSSAKRLRGGIVFVEEIPKTATGKNDRPKIKRMLKSKL